ncbi:spermatogenesis-associated protein 17 isoform X2 [Mastacembelus armatus]|uniref:spermatogenesis-associated protein 17 isoform X2 n=1 Tax=Mastacembelus armatus TaxID=205130 RepID=UPI000E45CDE3|nr:spermatogenesis-associated protein 17 isoform X2 [Mastacembelus armatus]
MHEAEENRQREHDAATRIQSWFRACKVRAYVRNEYLCSCFYGVTPPPFCRVSRQTSRHHLHKKAIIIQKIWRGFTARAHFRQTVKAAYFIMKMNFYNDVAVRIQRTWRGFFVRKYIHNFYARKKYLEQVCWKNEHIRRELDELEELQKRERNCLEMMKEQTAKVYKAHRLHHLMSTKQCPGVFNSPFRPAPHEMELLLRQVKYEAPTRLVPRYRDCHVGMPDSAAPSFPGNLGSPWIKTTRTCFSCKPMLPPIVNKKQQDLFREPGEVWQQFVNYPELMLRLQTSYKHLEEAQNQQ